MQNKLEILNLSSWPSCSRGLQCALLANSAGIGGGPFYVPLLNVVLGFDLKAATGLSHTIVGTNTSSPEFYLRTFQSIPCPVHHANPELQRFT